MKYEEKFPLIDSSLTNRISDEESQELENLRKDASYEEEYVFREGVHEAAKSMGREQLKKRLKQVDKHPGKVKKLRTWWLVAAAVVLLIIAVPFLMKAPSSADLYSTYYSKMPNKVVPITRSDEKSTELKLGFIQYQRGNYEDATAIFNGQVMDHPEIDIYLGAMAMEEERYQQAISILKPIAQDASRKFHTEAKWYLALSYLVNGNREESAAILDELIATENNYTSRATTLRGQLQP